MAETDNVLEAFRMLSVSDNIINEYLKKTGKLPVSTEPKPVLAEPKQEPTTDTSTTQNQNQPSSKPKRKCSEKQLAALAAGRAKNPKFANVRLKKKL